MKSMKKSMFITTILMVVLLVVALSTATFAWYTVNTQVNVTSTLVTSAASSAASLAIDKSANNASGNSEVTISMTSGLMPMIPNIKPVAGQTPTAYSAFTNNNPYCFFQAPINNEGNFTSNGQGTSPATISQVANGSQALSAGTGFYVINTDASNSTDVNAAITISTTAYTRVKPVTEPADFASTKTSAYYKVVDGEYVNCEAGDAWVANTYYKANTTDVYEDLRVAMFVGGNYVATWSYGGDNCYYGTITNTNNAVSSLSNDYTTLATAATASIGSIAAVSNKFVQLVAWFDGVGLEVDEAASAVFFTVTFSVAA